MSTDPQSRSPTVPGSILAGKYQVERILGQGGMGVVVEARHIALDERVALKFLLPEYATHSEAAARFLREARAAVRIKSEHVARVSDVGTLETGAPYMVMEYLEGEDLSRLVENRGVLPIPDAVDYVIQGCEAIAEAHGYGIVHRDVKPANLFLGKRPNGLPIVKVLDFGISKTSDNAVENLTKTTAAMGSALYMSPEQMQNTRGVDHRTDIYALGISLYELLAGRQPFFGETLTQLCAEIFTGTPTPLRALRPDIPEELAQVLAKAYERGLTSRYQTIAEFVVALAPFAPPRSQTVIESIAKMANIEVPTASTARPAPSRSFPASTVVLDAGRPPAAPVQQQAQDAHPSSAAGPLVVQQTSSNLTMSSAGTPKRGAGAAIAAALAVVVVLGGGSLFVFLRGAHPPAQSGAPAAADATISASPGTITAAPGSTAALPPPTVTAPAPPIDAPTASASTSPAAPPSAGAQRNGLPHRLPPHPNRPPTGTPRAAPGSPDVAGF